MNTLFDKIWDAHVVQQIEDGPTQLYIDRLYCHEVTSPQAFAGMKQRGLKCLRPAQIFCMPDHNTPTHDQDKPIEDPVSKKQVDTLAQNAADFGLNHFGMMHPKNGIIHVVGPERGLSLPGMTIVCGDSHTSTHGHIDVVNLYRPRIWAIQRADNLQEGGFTSAAGTNDTYNLTFVDVQVDAF